MPRGGRRPGAGAPYGNVNALVSANSSRRYKLALYFVSAVTPLRQFALARGSRDTPAGRQRFHLALDIAASVLRNVPDLPEQVEALLTPNLSGRLDGIEPHYARLMVTILDRRTETHYQKLYRALDFVAWAFKTHPGLYAACMDLLMPYVQAHPDYQPGPEPADPENPQSNNQSIKGTG